MSKLTVPPSARPIVNFHAEGANWTLYQLADNGRRSFLWPEFRLQLPGTVPARRGVARAYRLAWNPLELRFAKSREVAALERDHPGLARELDLHMSLNFDRSWLVSPAGAGATAAGIEAELARLKGLTRSRRARKRDATAPAGG